MSTTEVVYNLSCGTATVRLIVVTKTMAIKCQINKKIADTFNNYFTNIAQTIVNDIKYEGTKDFSYYLNRQIHSTFKINNIDEEAVKKIIHNLPTKHSCGFDGISSKFFKIIEPAIIKSLTMVINQVLNTGIFPDKLKIAKVTPIYKRGIPHYLQITDQSLYYQRYQRY